MKTGDKIKLLSAGYELLSKDAFIKIATLKLDTFTVSDAQQVMISDDNGENRRLVWEVYVEEIDDLIGLENIHWKKV
jgi:hypothetical protein